MKSLRALNQPCPSIRDLTQGACFPKPENNRPKGQRHNSLAGDDHSSLPVKWKNTEKKLNPGHSLRTTRGIKGTRQKVIVMHKPSEIDLNQLLLARFLNLGSDDIIIPGTANVSFNTELSSMADPK